MKSSKRIIVDFNNMMKERLGVQGIDKGDIIKPNRK